MSPIKSRLQYVKALVAFGEQELGLQFDGSFHRYVAKHRTANWLYAVEPTRFSSALPGCETFTFAWNRAALRRRERRYRAHGMHTYLYSAEAHGGRGCPITPSLLAATRARQGYVVLHEAWHSTLRLERIRMPYALEEATGRVVGVQGAVLFAEYTRDDALLREAQQQVLAWGALSRFVNRNYRILDAADRRGVTRAKRAALLREIRARARDLQARTASVWEHEELGREINNAFLFRYYDYTKLYPLAFAVHRAAGSLRAAMRLYKRAGRAGAIMQLREFTRAGASRIR